MESCNVLIECATEEELERFETVVKNYEKRDDSFRFVSFGATGKQKAFEIFIKNEYQFDIIFTQVTHQEYEESGTFIMRHGIDFEKRTGGILTLQFAYQLRDMNPFAIVVMTGEFEKFKERDLLKLVMKASKIGVETFVPMPHDGTSILELLLENLKSKVCMRSW